MNACPGLSGADWLALVAAITAGVNTILITWSHLSANQQRRDITTAINGGVHPAPARPAA